MHQTNFLHPIRHVSANLFIYDDGNDKSCWVSIKRVGLVAYIEAVVERKADE